MVKVKLVDCQVLELAREKVCYERVQPVGLTSLSYNWVILHIDMDQIKVQIKIHTTGIGLKNKNFFFKYGFPINNKYLFAI